jgi:hypothetical protein
MREGTEVRAARADLTAQGGEVAQIVKSGIEKDTAFRSG